MLNLVKYGSKYAAYRYPVQVIYAGPFNTLNECHSALNPAFVNETGPEICR